MDFFYYFFFNTQERSFQGCSDHPAAHCKRSHAHPGCKHRLAPLSHRVFCWVFGCGCAVSAAPHETHERGDRRTQVGALLLGGCARRRCGPFGTGSREKNMNEPENPAANSLLGWTFIRAPRSAHLNFIFSIRQKMVRTRSLAPFFMGTEGQPGREGKYFAVDF